MPYIQKVINDIFSSNTYLIFDENSRDVWLIDSGDIEKVIQLLPPKSIVEGVFLTHTHFDHIYGINVLLHHFPNVTVYVAEYGFNALYSAKKNLSFYHDTPLEYEGKDVTILHEGDTVEIFQGTDVKVFETPGHSPDSLTFLIDNYLFTGDAYIPKTPVVSKLPSGNKILAEQSKNKIINLSKGKIICPGHGDMERL